MSMFFVVLAIVAQTAAPSQRTDGERAQVIAAVQSFFDSMEKRTLDWPGRS